MKASEFVTERLALVLNWYRGMTNVNNAGVYQFDPLEASDPGCSNIRLIQSAGSQDAATPGRYRSQS